VNGWQLIAKERQRQLTEERWSDYHDDGHDAGQLAIAAACYAANETRASVLDSYCGKVQDAWPWDDEWDKREKHDRIRQLTIAGALCAAEIDRLIRVAALASEQREKKTTGKLPSLCPICQAEYVFGEALMVSYKCGTQKIGDEVCQSQQCKDNALGMLVTNAEKHRMAEILSKQEKAAAGDVGVPVLPGAEQSAMTSHAAESQDAPAAVGEYGHWSEPVSILCVLPETRCQDSVEAFVAQAAANAGKE
jgi:hypothetical protein